MSRLLPPLALSLLLSLALCWLGRGLFRLAFWLALTIVGIPAACWFALAGCLAYLAALCFALWPLGLLVRRRDTKEPSNGN